MACSNCHRVSLSVFLTQKIDGGQTKFYSFTAKRSAPRVPPRCAVWNRCERNAEIFLEMMKRVACCRRSRLRNVDDPARNFILPSRWATFEIKRLHRTYTYRHRYLCTRIPRDFLINRIKRDHIPPDESKNYSEQMLFRYWARMITYSTYFSCWGKKIKRLNWRDDLLSGGHVEGGWTWAHAIVGKILRRVGDEKIAGKSLTAWYRGFETSYDHAAPFRHW